MKHFVAVTLFDSLSSKKYVTYAPNDAIYIGKKKANLFHLESDLFLLKIWNQIEPVWLL